MPGGIHLEPLSLAESTGGATVSAEYRFATSIVEADPGNGRFRMDNATPASVTELFISSITDNGNDLDTILGLVSSGDQIYIQQDNDASKFVLLDVTANVDNTGWFSIAGTIAASGTIFDNNAKSHILILFGGTGGGGGDVFKVGTPVDDQLGIWTGDGTLEGDANLTWDGSELFVLGPAAAAAVTVNAPNPQIRFQESDVAVDEGNWRLIANSSRWRLQTSTDAAPSGGAATAFTVERTGFVVDSFDINAPVFSNTGNFDVGTEVLFTERADHVLTPAATRGILWVRDDAPNVLVFTDDAGTDQVLDPTTFGDVFKVGTPVDEEFAIWTGDGTLASTPDLTSDGVTMQLTPLIVQITQFFRSRGFDDRATARRCLLFNNVTQWGPADDDEYSFSRVLDTGSMGAAGGSGKTGGGNFLFRGDQHSILPGDFSMRSGVAVWLNWDESAGITTFSTGVGNPKTLALTIDASQDAAFEGNVDIGTEALFTERADHIFTPAATRGIVWVRDDVPNALIYTDDAGTDFVLNFAPGTFGDVFKVGTPVDNQIGVWTGDGTIEGDANLTWDGAELNVSGDADITGTVTVDALVQPVTKIIDIGDWNMDSTGSVSVAHGLTLADIRSVTATIRNDAATLSVAFATGLGGGGIDDEYISFDATNVILLRSTFGIFDGTDYDATSYNRGWITIQYVQ